METDGRDTTQVGDEGLSNVVRLPRDWLGSRDELVPFGPAAARADDGAEVVELTTRGSRTDATDDCTHDDFWGGDLGAIPKPVIAPAPVAPPRRERSPHPAHPPRPRSIRPRRRSGRVAARSARSLPRPTVSVAPMSMRAALVSVAAAALTVSAMVALGGAGTHNGTTKPSLDASQARASVAVQTPFTAALYPHRFVHLQMPRTNAPRVASIRRRRAAPPPASTTTYVKAVTSSTTVTSSTSSGSSSAGTSTSSTPVLTSRPVTTTNTSAATATTARKSGPVGPGAPFGPGHLG